MGNMRVNHANSVRAWEGKKSSRDISTYLQWLVMRDINVPGERKASGMKNFSGEGGQRSDMCDWNATAETRGWTNTTSSPAWLLC